jgi:hypothetical protein
VEAADDFFGGQIFAAQVLLQQLVFALGGSFHQVHARRGGRLGVVGGDVGELVALAGARLHRQQADDALKTRLLTPGELHRHELGAEGALHLLQGALEVGVLAIHLINDDEARQLMLVGILPYQLGADFHARNRVDHHHGRIGHAQRRFHFTEEVGEARRVDKIDFVLLVFDGDNCGGDGDVAAVLFVFKIRHRRAIFNPAQTTGDPGVVQKGFGQRGFARPTMAYQGDVANEVSSILFHLGCVLRGL